MLEYDLTVSQLFAERERKEVTICLIVFSALINDGPNLDKVLIETHGTVHFSVTSLLFQVYIDSKYLSLRFRMADSSACWQV